MDVDMCTKMLVQEGDRTTRARFAPRSRSLRELLRM